MDKIKLVHLVNFDLGLKIHIANYLRYQKEQGYDVSVVSHPGSWIQHDTVIQDDIFVKVIPFEPRISPLADLKTVTRLVRYFRQERFDIVHTSTVKPGLLGRLAAKIARTPVIVHTHRGLYLHEDMSPLQYRFFVGVEKVAAACCHSILSQNEEDVQTALRLKLCPPDKIHHLGNGIDISRFYPGAVPEAEVAALRANLGIAPDEAVIGIVARLVREKGIFEFLEAAHMLKAQGLKARYLAIGSSQKDKPTAVSPEGKIRELGLEEDVMLLGFRDDVPVLVSLMDVVVLPSYAEGIPRILMESAAMAKPMVASRVRGNVDVIIDGQTGLLVPVRDAPALAAAIQKMLNNPEMAAEMGRKARQRALTHFDERLYFYKTDAEYRRLLRERMRIDPTRVLKPIPSPST
jgi:glycosyltransferase involved in cell wall biosynthesis